MANRSHGQKFIFHGLLPRRVVYRWRMRPVDTTKQETTQLARPLFSDRSAIRQMELLDHFRVQLAGLYVAPNIGPSWDSDGRAEADYLHHIELVISGRRQIVFKGRVFNLLPGNIYFLPGHTPVERRWIESSNVIFAKVRCECLPGLDPLVDWPERRPVRIGPLNRRMYRDLLAPQNRGSFNRLLEFRGLIGSWIARIHPNLEAIIESHLLARVQFIKVLDFIEDNLGANLRIEELADIHGTSRRAFSALFTRSLGISPKEHLNRRLNQFAIELLLNTSLRVKEVAEKLGFAEEFYFSRFFSKLNGVSPAGYRSQFRAGSLLRK